MAAFSDTLCREVSPPCNIRVTCLQPGAVESELFEQVSDGGRREQMQGLTEQMTFLNSEDIGDAVAYALRAPVHVEFAELFIMPTTRHGKPKSIGERSGAPSK